MKTFELRLPYFKKGHDMAGCVSYHDTLAEAAKGHASLMSHCEEILLELADALEGRDASISADTHYISVSTSDEELIAILEGAEWAEAETMYA